MKFKRVALVLPFIDEEFVKLRRLFDPDWYHPLNLLSIATYLKKYSPEIEILLLDEQVDSDLDILNSITNFKPDILGITPSYFAQKTSLQLAKLGKSLGSKIVLGGAFATKMGKIMMQIPEVDYLITEDGEEAMLELVSGKPLDQIPNLTWRANGEIRTNMIKLLDLNHLPLIDYNLCKLERYFQNFTKVKMLNEREFQENPYNRPLTFYCQKGCRWRDKTGGCTFCACMYKTWRGRNPKTVCRDIIDCQEKYGIDSLSFQEDDFLAQGWWFDEFYRELISYEKHPGIEYIYARADSLNEDQIVKLDKLGCYQVYIGIESGSPKSQRSIHKGVSTKKTLEVVKLLSEYNILTKASFVIGVRGETQETLNETLKFCEELTKRGKVSVHAYPLLPTPGSADWNRAIKEIPDFRSAFQDKPLLDVNKMLKLWNENYSKVNLDTIEKTCSELVSLGISNHWNAYQDKL